MNSPRQSEQHAIWCIPVQGKGIGLMCLVVQANGIAQQSEVINLATH